MKRNIRTDKGAVTIVEATFIFPIMFFVLFFLLFYGNAWYTKGNADAVVSKYAIEAAAEISDPMLVDITETNAVSTENYTSQPYRYLLNGYGNRIVNKYKEKIEKDIDFAGFFSSMSPEVTNCSGKYNNYFLYQTVQYEVSYDIKIPIRMIFFESPTIIKFVSADEVPVCDSSELILNTNMVVDYVERTGLPDWINDKLDKVKKCLNMK